MAQAKAKITRLHRHSALVIASQLPEEQANALVVPETAKQIVMGLWDAPDKTLGAAGEASSKSASIIPIRCHNPADDFVS
jgi:hypothetical protein